MADASDLRTSFKLILRRKLVIIGGTLGCVVLAGAIGFILPPGYESSLILEIGQIYFSPRSGILEKQYIEAPEAVAKVMMGEGVLDEVRRGLQATIELRKLKRRLEVNTYTEIKETLPVLELVYQSNSPRETIDILNALAGMIIDRHMEKHRSYQRALEARIAYSQEKIAGIRKIIAAQTQNRAAAQRYIERGEASADEFTKQLGELGSGAPNAVDMLYLQGTALTEKQSVTSLTGIKASLDNAIGSNQKEIADTEMEIVALKNMRDFSTPTKIVSGAVLPEKPVKPKKLLMMLVAGLLGFAGSIFFVFFREYLKE